MKDIREVLELKAAELLAGKLNDLSKNQEVITLGLPGGTSVSGIFRKLSEKNLPWSKIQIFLTDERVVPLNDEESNFRLIRESLSPPSGFEGNIHSFDIKKQKIEDYQKEFEKFGDGFDIILLSSGPDGHVASLFPDHDSIKNESFSYISITNSPKNPSERISASRRLLESASLAILLFFGEEKQRAFDTFNDKEISVEECPAKLVNRIPLTYILKTV